MNKIITISREFGSGGRELGKRLAENLQIAYYDREIITAIAKKSSLAEDYVNQVVEQKIMTYYPITIASSFSAMPPDSLQHINRSIYAAQTEIMEELAQKSDCVIVGRCADHILRDYNPFNVFVYADMPSKMARCKQKDHEGSHLNEKDMQKNIIAIDKARAQYYRFYTGSVWGDKLNYDICINTSRTDIKHLADALADLIRARYE